MLKINFVARPAFIEAMRRKGPRIIQVLTSTLTASMLKLAAYVQRNKLSGQVLTPRSGNLRASITAIPATISGTKISAAVEGASSIGFYGTFHEFGGVGPYEIVASRARALAFLQNGKMSYFRKVTHPEIRKRAFMQPSLTENAEQITASLNAAVSKVVAEE